MAYGPEQDICGTVEIIEEPASRVLRYRYMSDARGRSAGSLPGVSSTPQNRTFPTIKICGYKGLVRIVASCVTKDKPFRPHSHNLVGRECKKGVLIRDMNITKDDNTCQFRNLGIQCVKRADIGEALRLRKELNINPFRTEFEYNPQNIDLNAVRIAFQVLIMNGAGEIQRQLRPVCTEVIYDKMNLRITKASHCSGTVNGGTEIILLCDKVSPTDTAVVFYQEEQGQVVWEQTATITHFHKQVAIVFTTPCYRNQLVSESVNVFFQLKRLSDANRSAPVSFEYIPDDQVYIGRKSQKAFNMPWSTYEYANTPEGLSSLNHGVPAQSDQNWEMPAVSPMPQVIPGSGNATRGPEIRRNSNNFVRDEVASQLDKISLNQTSPGLDARSSNIIIPNTSSNVSQTSPERLPMMPDLGYTSMNTNQVALNSSTVGQVTEYFRYKCDSSNRSRVMSDGQLPSIDEIIQYLQDTSSNTSRVTQSASSSSNVDGVISNLCPSVFSDTSQQTFNSVPSVSNLSQSSHRYTPVHTGNMRPDLAPMSIDMDQMMFDRCTSSDMSPDINSVPSGNISSNLLQYFSNQIPMDAQSTVSQYNVAVGGQSAQNDSGEMSVSSCPSLPLDWDILDSDILNKLSTSELYDVAEVPSSSTSLRSG